MTEQHLAAPTFRQILQIAFQKVAPYGGTAAAGVLAIGGFFVDAIDISWRIVLVAGAAVLALVGLLGIRWRAQREDTEAKRAADAEAEVTLLRAKLDQSAPGAVLDAVGIALFVKPGAWRLTLLVVEQTSDGGWCLSPLITRASSEVFEATAHGQIPLDSGPLREILDVDASDALQPFSNESANLPIRDVEPELWAKVHSQILPGTPNNSGMATRKFGWTVIKEPSSRRTLVLLSESVLADGIQLDVARSQLLAPTIALLSRMSGVVPLPEEHRE